MRIETKTVPPTDWDRYVDAHAEATAYHRAAAVCIGAKAFGLRTTFLTARGNDGTIVGILPLVEQSSMLFGRFISSVPFFTYGGVLADNHDVVLALADRAAELARERRVKHLELRHTRPIPGLSFQERLDKVSMVLPLPETEDGLARALGSKLRSQIRRADREQPEIVWGGAELIPEFYSVFAASMHELGTPVYPRSFFETASQALNGLAILVCRVGASAEAAAIVVQHGACVEVPWAAASAAAKKGAINMRMYWELLRHSIQRGARSFDFGRSTVDSGTYRFKAQWGAQPMQLHWHYWLPGAAQIPKLNQSNPKYALAAAVWRKMPLWCANLLGPHIVRNLP